MSQEAIMLKLAIDGVMTLAMPHLVSHVIIDVYPVKP